MSSNTKKVSDRVLLLAEWKPSVMHNSAECKSVNGFIFKNCCRWIKRQLCATSHLCRILKYPPHHMRIRRSTQSFHWLMVHGGFNLKRKWNSLRCKRQVILFSFLFFFFKWRRRNLRKRAPACDLKGLIFSKPRIRDITSSVERKLLTLRSTSAL